MSEKYLICVSACGVTSGSMQHADDLLDACMKVRALQESGVRRIEILLMRENAHLDYPFALDAGVGT